MPTPKSPVVEGLQAKEIIVAKNQPEYLPLPALVSEDRRKLVSSRWELTEQDRAMIAAGADVYVSQMTFGGKLQPLIVSVASKDMPLEVASSIFGVRIPPGAVRKKGPKKAYQCQACGTIFESDGTECPECSSKVVKELTGETASSNTVA